MTPAAFQVSAASQQFWCQYHWCIDPNLTVQGLLYHLGMEIDALQESGEAWKSQEHRLNIYLFACGIACAIDDYLARRRRLPTILRSLPLAGLLLPWTEWLVNLPARWRSMWIDSSAVRWRSEWTHCVDAACEVLMGAADSGPLRLIRAALATAVHSLHDEILDARMRIPEGFRCQDLAHDDIYRMVDRCLSSLPDKQRPIAVLGPRTAGAYFAPLAAAYLRSRKYARVHWITARPKLGLAKHERCRLASLTAAGASVLVIDDHQNTGNTMRLTIAGLRGLNVDPRDILIAVPGHPSNPGWSLPEETARGVRIFALPHEKCFKNQLIASNWGFDVLAACLSPGTSGPKAVHTSAADAINESFSRHAGDGFQVRLKRVFELRLENGTVARALAKSVGWGWLGYHAWAVASALQGCVPRNITLRRGFLFSEWAEGQPLGNAANSTDKIAEQLGSYIALRTASLPIWEDPWINTPGYRSGWEELIAALRPVYGFAGLFKTRGIRRRLRSYIAPQPALVDGRMLPSDWIQSGGRLIKTDFEHHNFGGGELNLVDPAWDLASAIFELRLSRDAEAQLLRSYSGATCDTQLHDRLLLYKILCATTAIRTAKYWLARKRSDVQRQEFVSRYIAARNFASFHIARHCGCNLSTAVGWTDRLFFLDLDGVLDWEFLGFAHTTPSGVQALDVLQRAGYSVVLNTDRSVDHVQEYCRAYHLPGGVAEHGSVFWDAICGREIPLIDNESRCQLQELLAELRKCPGVLIDPTHRYSIRACRWHDSQAALVGGEIERLLAREEFLGLTLKHNQADTFIRAKSADKGAAMWAVKSYLGLRDQPVAAMGDSNQDLEMLAAADIAFAPANASAGVRELIRHGKCRRTRHRLQAGLLEAALELTHRQRPTGSGNSAPPSATFFDALLRVADRHPLVRTASAVAWRGL